MKIRKDNALQFEIIIFKKTNESQEIGLCTISTKKCILKRKLCNFKKQRKQNC